MERRDILAGIAITTAVGALGYGALSTCGNIPNVDESDNGKEADLSGEVTRDYYSDSRIRIYDGNQRATLQLINSRTLEEGECVSATGTLSVSEHDSGRTSITLEGARLTA